MACLVFFCSFLFRLVIVKGCTRGATRRFGVLPGSFVKFVCLLNKLLSMCRVFAKLCA